MTSIMRAICKSRITTLYHLVFYTLSHLKTENDEEKDSVSSEENTGLLDTSTVAEEGDDENEGTQSNQQVAGLINDCWLHKFPKQSAGIFLFCRTERTGSADVDVKFDECFFADSHPGSHN